MAFEEVSRVNFSTLFKAVDAMMAFRDAAKGFKGVPSKPPASSPDAALAQAAVAQGLAGQIETRLTGVVVAALKEAFDRDHARLELERAHMEEERRRAEELLRLEMRRQAVERELARLRLLAGTALVGWIASIATLGFHHGGIASHAVLAIGWLLLLGGLGAAFAAQGRINTRAADVRDSIDAGALPLWLLIAGLAATAISLLF
jgi:hypothetical protein